MSRKGNATPGPWHAKLCRQNPRDTVFFDADVTNTTKTLRVARVSGVGPEQCQANAQLVATAPKLLAVLKEALACFQLLGAGEKSTYSMPEMCEMVGSAISEAEEG
jgi:hypothetical protein